MKNLVMITVLMTSIALYGQDVHELKEQSNGEVKIQTSAQCGMCKERIEKDVAFEKGVRSVDLDLETKVLTITYNQKRTNPEKLRSAVTKIGYDADDKEADPKAYEKLPECCKKGGHD